jgi:hypothetical protein
VSPDSDGAFGRGNDQGLAKVFCEPKSHLSHVALLRELHATACADKNIRAGPGLRIWAEDNSPLVDAFVWHAINIFLLRPRVKELR